MSRALAITTVAYKRLPKWTRLIAAGVAGVLTSGAIFGHF